MSAVGREGVTLVGPRRCPYCGHLPEWRDKWPMWRYGACRHCADLAKLEAEMMDEPELPTMGDELRAAKR